MPSKKPIGLRVLDVLVQDFKEAVCLVKALSESAAAISFAMILGYMKKHGLLPVS